MSRLVMTINYDGSGFAGSQAQPRMRTVQGELERSLATLKFADERTVFAGRTDRGVHAAGQIVACGDRRPDLRNEPMRSALNALLPDDIAVELVERRADEFQPRFDARWREYRYRVWSGERTPLARTFVWRRKGRLDGKAMALAAHRFVGTRDFASVAGGGDGVPWSVARARTRGTTRTVHSCNCQPIAPWWGASRDLGRLYEIQVVADGFLPRMVRNIVAIIVRAGHGEMTIDAIDALLLARDRRVAGATAPAHGLTLWQVGYTAWAPTE